MNPSNAPSIRRTGVTGQHTVAGRPRGVTSLTPFLVVTPAAEALRFYTEVFGARLVDRTDFPGPDGKPLIAHAVLDFGTGQLQLGDANPAFHLVPPPTGGDDCYSMGLYCEDVDALLERAVSAGAVIREPPSDFVSGDRFASIRDPFGVRWSLMTRIEDLSEEESAKRVADWARETFKGA